jgi:dCTP deaminase
MILKADQISERLERPPGTKDPLVITPQPDLNKLRLSGAASVDLRLGTWFVTLRHSRASMLAMAKEDEQRDRGRLARTQYVPFGETYFLHPGQFILGATMEWIRIPRNLAGYVVGKSSLGRLGLVIATAVGVHPGFSACLTLEITNLGQMPFPIIPGMLICQLFLHQTDSKSDDIDKSRTIAKRKPTLGLIDLDPIARKLRKMATATD